MSTANPNTLSFWDGRFGTGDWERKGGFNQTKAFAASQIPRLGLDGDFAGTLCDFGCGAGDAFPLYREAFPSAKLIGVDFSAAAVELCRKRFGDLGTFVSGTEAAVPECDLIVASNVMEHLDDDEAVVRSLLRRCKRLIVVVPFREQPLDPEHIRQYSEQSFSRLKPVLTEVFLSMGWSEYGKGLLYHVYAKNILRALTGKVMRNRNKQILFEFRGLA